MRKIPKDYQIKLLSYYFTIFLNRIFYYIQFLQMRLFKILFNNIFTQILFNAELNSSTTTVEG